MSNNYSVINGQLYKDGVKVEIEIGNKEQINFLKYYASGIQVSAEICVTNKLQTYFKCCCGQHNFIDMEVDSDDDFEDLNGLEKICHGCNRVYVFEHDEDGCEEDFLVKVKEDKKQKNGN